MSTTVLSAMLVGLLTATCMTALADSANEQNRSSTVGEPTAVQASTAVTSLVEDVDTGDDAGPIQAVGRTGSHSMHPNAPVVAEQFADDKAKVQRHTGDQ